MTDYKEGLAERKDFIRGNDAHKNKPTPRVGKKHKKPFTVQHKMARPHATALRFPKMYNTDWSGWGNFKTRKAAEQSLAKHKADTFWGGYEWRIIER